MHIYKVVIEYDLNLWKYTTTTTMRCVSVNCFHVMCRIIIFDDFYKKSLKTISQGLSDFPGKRSPFVKTVLFLMHSFSYINVCEPCIAARFFFFLNYLGLGRK